MCVCVYIFSRHKRTDQRIQALIYTYSLFKAVATFQHEQQSKSSRISSANPLELGLNSGETESLSDSSSVLRVTLVEDSDLSLLNISVGVLEVSNDVVDEVSSLLVVHDLSEEGSGLSEVAVGVAGLISLDETSDLLGRGLILLSGGGSTEGVGLVVGSASLISIDDHEAVSDSVGDSCSEGAVDRDLVVVASESVSVGIDVREQSSLEHSVSRGLDSGDHVSGSEGDLLDLGEVVVGVSVEDHLSDGDEGVLRVGPDLGDVEDVPLVVGGIGLGHDLDIEGPGGGLSFRDVLEEVSGGIVGIAGLDAVGFLSGEVLDSGVGLEVPLDVEGLVVLVDPSESVGAISVHVSVTVGSSSVREEDGDLVHRLRDKRQEVPEHVGVLQIGLRVSLLRVDEVRELAGVSNEEHGRVVSDHVPVSFFSVELDGETAGISLSVRRTLLASDGGETSEDGSPLADGVEELGLAVFGDVVGDLKVSPGSSTLGVDDSLRDSLSVEFSQLVDEVEVLEKEGSVLSG